MRFRITALLLTAVLLLGMFPVSAAGGGRFALLAVADADTVVIAQYVTYAAGETLADALRHSGHTFMGLDEGYVTEIDGTAGSYLRYSDGGVYDLDVPADGVQVLWFTTNAEQMYSDALCDLALAIVDFGEQDAALREADEPKRAYEAARAGFYGADADTARALSQALSDAIARYEARQNGEKYTLTLRLTQDGGAVRAGTVTLRGRTYGDVVTQTDADSVRLLPDIYEFDLSDGDIRHVSGTVTVEGDTVLTAELPPSKSRWIASVELGIASGDAWRAVERDGNAYLVPDYAGTALYPEITYSAEVDPTVCRVYWNDEIKVWQSHASALQNAVEQNSLTGATLELQARQPSGDYIQYETQTLQIVRLPTLSALELQDASGGVPTLDFSPDVTEYWTSVTADSVRISAAPQCAGTEVRVNGAAGGEVSLSACRRDSDGAALVQITLNAAGAANAYTLHIRQVEPAYVTITHTSDALELANSAGVVLQPSDREVYRLIPGEEYQWTTTSGSYFHATGRFIAENNLTVSAAAPETADRLSELEIRNLGNENGTLYSVSPNFSAGTHAYTVSVDANTAAFYLRAVTEDAAEAAYLCHPNANAAYAGTARTVTLKPDGYTNLPYFIASGGIGNRLTLTLRHTDGQGVTQYQEYLFDAVRVLTANDISLTDGAGNMLQLTRPDGTAGYQKNTTAYTCEIAQAAETVTVLVRPLGSTVNDHAFTLAAECGERHTEMQVEDAAAVQTLTIALDASKKEETVQIRLAHEGAVSQTYTVVLTKLPPVRTVFHITPEDATLFLTDVHTGTRIFTDRDGACTLNAGGTYLYHVTKNGYIGASEQFTADGKEITVHLAKAPEHTLNDIAQTGDWLGFRADANNNGVVAVKTPLSAENTVVEWATQPGTGYAGNATGCPILVGGCLYTYAGRNLLKLDKDNGTVLARGEMAAGSSFAINSPTYGEGMIFVGLRDGRVQAFNAETLESLWLYTDPLGGQPNCPIVYHDGYVYTGFWNSETKKANFVCLSVTDEAPEQSAEEKIATWRLTGNGYYWAGAYVSEQFAVVPSDDGESGYTSGHATLTTLHPLTGAVLDRLVLPSVGDARSSICYDAQTDAYYFTTKGGDFYSVRIGADGKFGDLRQLHLQNEGGVPMSTSTPVIYRGRAYLGVSGAGQFSAYSGHSITVIDLPTFTIAYTVPTMGYPQVSGLLTTAYEAEDGFVYVYFVDNYTPGTLRMIRDRAGMNAPDPAYLTAETYHGKTYTAAYPLFTPSGAQAQYAICSPIADSEGNLYFKNDSGWLMKVGSTIRTLTVEREPDKMSYCVGELFDASGLRVSATYANGAVLDVTDRIAYTTEPLTADDREITLSYRLRTEPDGEGKAVSHMLMYQNRDGRVGVPYTVPNATLTISLVGGCDGGASCPSRKWTDVPAPDNWAHAGIDYAISRGLMNGMEGNTFQPETSMSRAMLVTVLWRSAGSPKQGKNTFPDVPNGKWYTDAVAWAAANGIVNGVEGGRFDPNGNVTREQMATILYRYCAKLGIDASKAADLSAYPDASAVSGYALAAMRWAVAEGILNGSDGLLLPRDDATRAQVATLLMRFFQHVGV